MNDKTFHSSKNEKINTIVVQLIKKYLADTLPEDTSDLYTTLEMSKMISVTKREIETWIRENIDFDEIIDLVDLLTIADLAEVIAGVINDKAVSPKGLHNKIASQISKGLFKLTTYSEGLSNSINDKFLTPESFHNRIASTSSAGLVQFATAGSLADAIIGNNAGGPSIPFIPIFELICQCDTNVFHINLGNSWPINIGGEIYVEWGDDTDPETDITYIRDSNNAPLSTLYHMYDTIDLHRITIKLPVLFGNTVINSLTNNSIIILEKLSAIVTSSVMLPKFGPTLETIYPCALNDFDSNSIEDMFKGTSIIAIPAGLFDETFNFTTCMNCFSNTPLLSIPDGLFANHIKLRVIDRTFSNCTSLRTVASNIFNGCTNIVSANYVFSGCSSITSAVPKLWDKTLFPNITSYVKCFEGCVNASNYNDIPNDWK